jgi:hypothetical protein
MSTTALTVDELSTSPNLCGGGQPAGDGGGDVLVAGMRTCTDAGDEPIRFDADRGAAMGGGSGGNAGEAGDIAGGAGDGAELGLST